MSLGIANRMATKKISPPYNLPADNTDNKETYQFSVLESGTAELTQDGQIIARLIKPDQ